MAVPISITETAIFTALGNVLLQYGLTSAAGPNVQVPIVRGQINRVPQVAQDDFVEMWSISRDRLAMNIDDWLDNNFVGSITNNVLTVTQINVGPVPVGQPIYSNGITTGCTIVRQLMGITGDIGTYQTTPTAPISSQTIYAGTVAHMQKIEFTAQVDVHGPASADNAVRITTLWRDQFTVSAFQDMGVGISPLYSGDPKQMPFQNDQQQIEDRWVIDLRMQINPIVITTAQFADQLDATAVSVETLAIA